MSSTTATDVTALLPTTMNPRTPLTPLDDMVKEHEPPKPTQSLYSRLVESRLSTLYMLMNLASSISIVLLNKWVYHHFLFNYGTVLTFLHFFTTWLGLLVSSWLFGLFEIKKLPVLEVAPLALLFCGFVVLTNLSLQYNSVGFYQLAKVMTTPVIICIQAIFFQTRYSLNVILSLGLVVCGVILASVSDVQLNLTGSLFAASGVLVTSCYQIFVGRKQKSLNVNSMQLLVYQAPVAALMLLFIAPIFDDCLPSSPTSFWYFDYTPSSVFVIVATSVIALSVNLSIFLVIGNTSAVSYNVLGHFKLCFILCADFILFAHPLDLRNLAGILIALIGIFYYTYLKLQKE